MSIFATPTAGETRPARIAAKWVALAILSCVAACTQAKQAADDRTDNCRTLSPPANVTFEDTPGWQASADLPRYCQVRGVIGNRIHFEYRLPKDWNGRFMMAGCGGFCGALTPDKKGHSNSINEALKRGYAAISHDSGHQAPSYDTRWAYDDPEALEIWAHKVLPMVTDVGVALASKMYGRAPQYRYFSGCSNGGRLGLVAAQRYPHLFDGIAAGGAIFDVSGIAGLWGNWMIRQSNQPPQIPSEKAALIKSAVMAHCDQRDDLEDGIITDPRQCDYDFTTLQCAAEEAEHAECLTAPQAQALNALYGGVRTNDGKQVYPGLAYSSEHYSDIWLFGSVAQPGWGVQASTGYRNLLTNALFGKEFSKAPDTDTLLSWNQKSSIPRLIDAKDTDLSGLAKANTRLMIYQGWSDPLIIPGPIVNYYKQASAHASGPAQPLAQHARLFMIPGWGHCWERPADAPDQFDPLQILEQWVEQGVAPDYFIARKLDAEGGVSSSRPICAYPKIARYSGNGDVNDAANYRCSDADVE